MSTAADKDFPKNSDTEAIPFEDLARARREGACVSPGGTEGCQWDGSPRTPPSLPATNNKPRRKIE